MESIVLGKVGEYFINWWREEPGRFKINEPKKELTISTSTLEISKTLNII